MYQVALCCVIVGPHMTLLGLQSNFGDNLLKIRGVCLGLANRGTDSGCANTGDHIK